MTPITEHIPIDDAGAILAELPDRLAEGDRAIALTLRGKPELAVMSWDAFEGIFETMEILSDLDMLASLARGIEDERAGNLVPIEDVVARLGLPEAD